MPIPRNIQTGLLVAILAGLLTACGCVHYAKYVPDPERDVGQWVQNFRQQRSFECEYRVRTRTTDVQGRSSSLPGWAERVRGIWKSGSTDNRFEHVGINDLEFTRIEGRWQEAARGEESNLFAQIDRLLSFGKFEYLSGSLPYQYRFKPNVPFIAPERWREITGWLTVSPDNYLPQAVWAGLPDSSVFWRCDLSRYNKLKKIKSPITRWLEYAVAAADSSDVRQLSGPVRKRLKLIGAPHRVRTEGKDLVVSLPVYYRESDLLEMLAPGRAVFYRTTADKHESIRTVFLKSDPKDPIHLSAEVFRNASITGCRIRFDPSSRPYLDVSVKKGMLGPPPLVFEIDSVFQGRLSLDKTENPDKIMIDISMSYFQMNMVRAYLLQPLPLLTAALRSGD